MPRARQPRNVARAKRLRGQMSLPEVLLWQYLRKQPDVRFRRQHPIGPYVLDFYCAASKLCIEIDGIAHDMGGGPARDTGRDEWLQSKGIGVLRISAAEVLRSPGDTAEVVLRYLDG